MKFKTGIMLWLLMSVITLGSYASPEPQTNTPPSGENAKQYFSDIKTSDRGLVAQLTAPTGTAADYTDQNKKDSTGTKVVNIVTSVVPAIKVDTVNNPGDIAKEGTYLVKSIHKGMTVTEILSLIFGVISFAFGLYFYFRHKSVKDALAAAQSQLSNKAGPTS